MKMTMEKERVQIRGPSPRGRDRSAVPVLAAGGGFAPARRRRGPVLPRDEGGCLLFRRPGGFPASGRVIDIREAEEKEFLRAPARRVSIFMSVLDEHVNYAPIAGVVDYLRHRPGSFHRPSSTRPARPTNRWTSALRGTRRRP